MVIFGVRAAISFPGIVSVVRPISIIYTSVRVVTLLPIVLLNLLGVYDDRTTRRKGTTLVDKDNRNIVSKAYKEFLN